MNRLSRWIRCCFVLFLLLLMALLAKRMDSPSTYWTYVWGAFLGATLGTILVLLELVLRKVDTLHASLSLENFPARLQRAKDILVDCSALIDPRMFDFAATGILDKRLVLPKFLLKDLENHENFGDEVAKVRAKKIREVIKKLETMSDLHLRYHDTDFPEVRENLIKLIRLAHLVDADILISDMSRINQHASEHVKVLNLHHLSSALKPMTGRGEYLKIRIQRPGKEEKQGVGYLDDGTMVVVNGGSEYIGKTIQASVLSAKPTTSGRIIFCNVAEEQVSQHVGEEVDY